MKLWQKEGYKQDDKTLATQRFTVGNDREWDMRLAEFDVIGSMAHANMLEHIGIISAEESGAIRTGLETILEEVRGGKFVIEEDVEDVHSQVEKLLTERIGDAGKKLHT